MKWKMEVSGVGLWDRGRSYLFYVLAFSSYLLLDRFPLAVEAKVKGSTCT